MKRFLFILPFLILVSFSKINTVKNSKTVRITPKSELQINGTSNVKDFTCEYEIQNLNKPIRIHYEKEQDIIKFEKSVIILENNGFDCGGKGINKDFHGLLQSDIYPRISLTLKQINLKSDKKNMADALIDIEIAGLTKSYHMETTFQNMENWLISGKLKLNIKDFKLEAPKKMFGLVVVSDEIEISFKLVVEES
ncbi:YceI family protein [Gelidibacter sp.]|uniref:YceI family protein n=1 Tax=Gelidibacter sp. TaxID=2018083 RepID=UPI002CFAFC9A|nr:YceI family protein [Gelidibacter sp.]HUH28114.1 YceI family protein [Gelidibacter sp.]